MAASLVGFLPAVYLWTWLTAGPRLGTGIITASMTMRVVALLGLVYFRP